jgi:leader peptidase (prepilin peptidase) / N-methyltransferase
MVLYGLSILLAGFIGWIIGAIINYIADVLPANRRLQQVKCPGCGQMIPVGRYLSLSTCAQCRRQFSKRNYILQFGLTLLFILLAIFRQIEWIYLFRDELIVGFFSLVIVIDIEHHLILHSVSGVGAILLGIIGLIAHGLLRTTLGAAAGLGIMFSLFYLGLLFGKILSKKRGVEIEEALGFGDVILGGVCGLLLGWPGVILGLFLGIILGGIYSLILVIISLMKKEYHPYMTIPYGPFLAGATLIFWIFR